MLDSQEVPASVPLSEQSNERQEDLIDLNDDQPSTSTAGLHSSAGMELPAVPTTMPTRSSSQWLDQVASQLEAQN